MLSRSARCLPRWFLLLLVVLLAARSAWAGVNRWTPIGPWGGTISSLVLAPSDRRTLYAGTDSGLIFRSIDAGAHWTLAGDGFPPVPVADLAVDPVRSSTVYAAICQSSIEPPLREGGVFKSTDGGGTWHAVMEGLEECAVQSLAIDPRHPSTLFAATLTGLFRSEDGGASWQRNPGLADAVLVKVAFDPTAAGVMYAADFNRGVFKSTDGGVTWTAKNFGLPALARPLDLTLDPAAPGRVYLVRQRTAGRPATVYRSTDGGESWSAAANGLGTRAVKALAVAPASVLYAATADGVFRSSDRGEHWTAPNPATAIRPVGVLAVPPAPVGVLYAGAGAQGVFRSVNGGATWQQIVLGLHGIPATAFELAPSNSSVLYSGMELGTARTMDGGASWRLSGLEATPTVLAVDSRDPQTVYASSPSGRIWKSSDASAHWKLIYSAPACRSILDLAIDPVNPANVFAAGAKFLCSPPSTACESIRSRNGGKSWSCMPVQGAAVAIDPGKPTDLWAARSGVSRSTDAGKTWAAASNGLPPSFFTDVAFASPGSTLYAANPSFGLYRSTNRGGLWTPVHQGLPSPRASEVEPDPRSASTLYALAYAQEPGAASRFLPFVSTDGGTAWQPLPWDGLPAGDLRSLRAHRQRPGTLWIATHAGIYVLTLPATE